MFNPPYSLVGVLSSTSSDVDYYFAGFSVGFRSKYQHQSSSDSSESYDTFVYKYNFLEDLVSNRETFHSCIYAKSSRTSTVDKVVTAIDTTIDGDYFYFDPIIDSVQRTRRGNNNYKLYLGKHFKVQQLMSAIVTPRPCAYKSANMFPITYLRGQGPKAYDINDRRNFGASEVSARMD